MDKNWIEIADVNAIADGESLECVAADKIIALFRIENEFHAIDGICPHHGGPLGQGSVEGCIVSCPWHGWKFDVTSGAYQSSDEMFQRTYPVQIENERVFVNVDDPE